MRRVQHFFLAICVSTGVLSLQVDAVRADDKAITVVRPGACSAHASHLSTEATGAAPMVLSVQDTTAMRTVSGFQPYPLAYEKKGWAAERLLKRFDLQTTQKGVQIINTSPFCVEER